MPHRAPIVVSAKREVADRNANFTLAKFFLYSLCAYGKREPISGRLRAEMIFRELFYKGHKFMKVNI